MAVEAVPLARALRARRQARRRAGSSPRSRSCRRRAWTRRRCSSSVRLLKAAGVDAVNVPDGPRAQSRMGALSGRPHDRAGGRASRRSCTTPAATATCSACCRTCSAPRPRASATCSSSPAIRRRWGPYPEATAVFDIDSIGLTNLVSRLNHGLDPGGNPIGAPTALRHRRGGQSRRARSRPRASALRLEGRGGRRVRDHPAGVRPGAARPVPQAGRAVPDSDRGRHLAAGLAPQRGVPGQRGARRVGARPTSWSGCGARAPGGRTRRWRRE